MLQLELIKSYWEHIWSLKSSLWVSERLGTRESLEPCFNLEIQSPEFLKSHSLIWTFRFDRSLESLKQDSFSGFTLIYMSKSTNIVSSTSGNHSGKKCIQFGVSPISSQTLNHHNRPLLLHSLRTIWHQKPSVHWEHCTIFAS